MVKLASDNEESTDRPTGLIKNGECGIGDQVTNTVTDDYQSKMVDRLETFKNQISENATKIPVAEGYMMFMSGIKEAARNFLIELACDKYNGYHVKLVCGQMAFLAFKTPQDAVDFAFCAEQLKQNAKAILKELQIGVRYGVLNAACGYNGVDYCGTTINSLSRLWKKSKKYKKVFICKETKTNLPRDQYRKRAFESYNLDAKGICISVSDNIITRQDTMIMYTIKPRKPSFNRCTTVHPTRNIARTRERDLNASATAEATDFGRAQTNRTGIDNSDLFALLGQLNEAVTANGEATTESEEPQ